MKLFEELKRRNVFRVAGVYAVVAWLLVQVVVAVEAPLSLPAWTDTLVIVLFGIGFPIAMILAWAFEMTPEGMKLTANVPEGESVAPKTGRKLDYAILAGLALVGAMVVADRLAPKPARPVAEGAAPKAGAPSVASIAVLPFADLSPAGDQEYFSQGIAEEILNVLANVSGLAVASRTSSFQFKGQEKIGVPLIAEQLHVRHILEGSVRKSGDAIRITAQLIDAETDKHLWSETFDRTLTTDNIFAVQDEITKAIVEQLSSRMGGSAIAAPAARRVDTQDTDAYALYLKGRALFIARGRENLASAMEAFEKAIRIDANFARAYAALSAVYAISPNWGFFDRDYNRLALAAADAALRLNPDLAQPYATRGFVGKSLISTDKAYSWESTLADLDEAVRRDPNDATVRFWRGLHYDNIGYFDRAIAEMGECYHLDPAYQNCRRFAALTHLHAERTDQALALFEAGLKDGFFNANLPFAAAYAARGERVAVLALIVQPLSDTPKLIEPVFRALTDPTFDAGDRAAALADLNSVADGFDEEGDVRYILKDFSGLVSRAGQLDDAFYWYRHDAAFLKSTERKALIRKFRLPEYWRAHGFPPQCKPVVADDFECD